MQKRPDPRGKKDDLLTRYDLLARAIGETGNTAGDQAYASMLNRATALQASHVTRSLIRFQEQYGNRYVQRVLALSKKAEGEAEATLEVEKAIQGARGGGQVLDSWVRAQMERAFGADFGGVRVHAGTKADTLNRTLSARAFTTSHDIFFRQGEYNPGTSSGRALLAHELTHVVRQNGGSRRKLTVGQRGDVYEQEADQVARDVTQQEAPPSFARRQSEDAPEEQRVREYRSKESFQRQSEELEEEREAIQTNELPELTLRQMDVQQDVPQTQIALGDAVRRQTDKEEESTTILQMERAPGAETVATTENEFVRQCITQGTNNETVLTNQLFYRRHPNISQKTRLARGSAQAEEWLTIRDQIVRPALRGQQAWDEMAAFYSALLFPLRKNLDAILGLLGLAGVLGGSQRQDRPSDAKRGAAAKAKAESKLKSTLNEAIALEKELEKKHGTTKLYASKPVEAKGQYNCVTYTKKVLERAGYKLEGSLGNYVLIATIDWEKAVGTKKPTETQKTAEFRKRLAVDDPAMKGVVTALVASGQGDEVKGLADLKEGDFLQYWYYKDKQQKEILGHSAQVAHVLTPAKQVEIHGAHGSKGIGTIKLWLTGQLMIKVYAVRPRGNVTTPVKTSAETESPTWPGRAVRSNSTWGPKLGWLSRVDEIVSHFQKLGYLPPLQTPNEEVFARAVKQYQSQYSDIADDGVLGPNTWSRLRADLSGGDGIGRRPGERPPTRAEGGTRAQPGRPHIVTRLGVVLTPQMEQVLDELETFFGKADLRVQVSSGVRTPESQLDIIKRRAIKYGLDKKYPSLVTATVADVESWRDAWDELLNVKGFIVNPPQEATCKLGKRAGKVIFPSPHMRMKAFDLTGAPLESIEAVVAAYKKAGGPISQILPEPVNNCVHIGIK